ncbi:hypothetical protein AK88_02676 [Plasmodium fragile]|uniref:Uncharacterized protein n=1 Tax=Plasmodium fragile TaxID=5857 RepID=A0A0D9QL34_PLAFR|nr:uncharacterized protein AK88_02676 [Plasmodium fragile]KJP87648.1 hypothetical protein AK88_02676 [Plasmodium fragile]
MNNMWIEKDMGGRCARGGALSQQVNDGIETLKRNNNFLFSGIGGNLPSEATKRRCDERLRRPNCSTVLPASTSTSRCRTTTKGDEKSSEKSKGREAPRYRKGEQGEEMLREDNWRDKTNSSTCRNDDGGKGTNKNWRKLGSDQVTSSRKRHNQQMDDKCLTSGSKWKRRNVNDCDGTQYKSTQYLNNSAVYNDSVVNNETVVCPEWPEMSNSRGDSAMVPTTERKGQPGCKLSKADEHQMSEADQHEMDNADEGMGDPPLMAPLSRKQKDHLTNIQSIIQKDIPALIKNTVNNHLAKNINYQVQEAIKKKLPTCLDHNGVDMLEKKIQSFSTRDVQAQLSDLVNSEMRKNESHMYATLGKRIQQNVNAEMERNTNMINKQIEKNVADQIEKNVADQIEKNVTDQIEKNVTDQIETNLEKVYNEVDLKVGKKVSNELAKNMNSVQNNLLQNVNNELKRKVKLIGANVDSQIKVLISHELNRNLNFLHNRINDNMSRELKKCLSILNRNFDENLHEQMDRCVQIFLTKVCECLSDEIKNKVNMLEKNIIMNWDDHVVEKVTSRTEVAINRVQETMIIMDNNTTNRAEGISSEVRSGFDQLGVFVKEGICGDLQRGLQGLGKENEVASAKMAQVICAKVEAATGSEMARHMGALLGGLRDEVIDKLGSVRTSLKGSLEGTLKRSVDTTLKRSLEETLIRSVDTTLRGIMETILREQLSKTKQTLHTGACEGEEEEAKRTDAKLETVLKSSNENFNALIKVQKSLATNLSKEMKVVKDMNNKMMDVKTFLKTWLTSVQKKLSDAMEKNTSVVINTSESVLRRLDSSCSGSDEILNALCEKVIEQVADANEKYAHRIAEEVGTMAKFHQSFMKDQRMATEERLEKLTQDLFHLNETAAQKTHERLKINNEDVLSTFIETVQTEKVHMIMHTEEIVTCLKKSIEEHSTNVQDHVRGLLNEKDEHMMEGLKRVSSEFDIKLGEQAKQFLSHLDRKINDAVGGRRVQCEGGTDMYKHPHQVQRSTLGTNQVKPIRVEKRKRYLIGSDVVANPLGSPDGGDNRETKRGTKRDTHGEMHQPNRHIGKSVNKRNLNQPQNNREATSKRKPIYFVNYFRSKNNDLVEVVQHLHEQKRKKKKIITLCGP